MTEAELQALTDDWRIRLRLQDWDIRARFGKRRDVPGNAVGECEWRRHPRQALITVVRPEEIGESVFTDLFPEDIEETVVHELLHIYWVPFSKIIENGSHEDAAMEQAINALAACLVALKRGQQPGLTVGGLENALEDWQAAVAASPNPEKLNPLDPKRVVVAPMMQPEPAEPVGQGQVLYPGRFLKCPHCGDLRDGDRPIPTQQWMGGDPEPAIYCAECERWSQVEKWERLERRDQQRHAAPQQDLKHVYTCTACGEPFNARGESHVIDAQGEWHSRCHPDRRRDQRSGVCPVCRLSLYPSDPQIEFKEEWYHAGCFNGPNGPYKPCPECGAYHPPEADHRRREHEQEQMIGGESPQQEILCGHRWCPNCDDRLEGGRSVLVDAQGRWRCPGCEVWTPRTQWGLGSAEVAAQMARRNVGMRDALKEFAPNECSWCGEVIQDGEHVRAEIRHGQPWLFHGSCAEDAVKPQ